MTTTSRTAEDRFARDTDPRQGAPDGPEDLPARDWRAALKHTFKGVKNHNLTDWAAALTYYGIQALFPALLVLVSLLGLFGRSTTDTLITNVGQVSPGPAKTIFTNAVHNLQSNKGAAGIMVIVGIVVALWSASGYISAFARASNAIYEVDEGRKFWRLRPQQVAIAFVMVVLLAVSAVAVVVTGGLAEQVGNVVGVGDTAVTVWDIAKWPVLLLVVSFMFAFLYWGAPNVRQPKFRWLSPGGVLAVAIWIVSSLAFAFYVANFANYNKTYGTFGGVIV